jgi:hypothetical protein
LGRPDCGTEEEEHDEGFRREPVVGSSDAEKKGRGIISRITVIVTLPTQQWSYLASEPKPIILLCRRDSKAVACGVLSCVSKMSLLNLQLTSY